MSIRSHIRGFRAAALVAVVSALLCAQSPEQAQKMLLQMIDQALRSRAPASYQVRPHATGDLAEASVRQVPHAMQVTLDNMTAPPGGSFSSASVIEIILRDNDFPLNLSGAAGLEMMADIPENVHLRLMVLPELGTSYGACSAEFNGVGSARYTIPFVNLRDCWSEGGFDPSRVSAMQIINETEGQKATFRIKTIGLRL
ncbi:MAG: hypothetical protein J6Y56_03445 [Fibrobacterales bacterium]|nr:hypothetical protein [Fibrobacterales bacterium]